MDLSFIDKEIKNLDDKLKKDREFQKELEAMEQYGSADRVVPATEILAEIEEDKKLAPFSFNTRIPTLDKLIGGFREGQLVVVSGPTGQGKTLLLQDFTHSFSEQKVNSLWLSYEVGMEEFFDRFNGKVPNFYLPRQIRGSSLDWLKMRILEGIAKYNTKVVFVDHLHFLLEMGDLAKAKNLSLLIGMLMRDLKKFAVKTKTTIFLVSHMRKSRLDSKPTIEDLRDSSFVAQESDLVMMVWRLKNKDTDEYVNESKVIVEKNRRTGNLGGVKIAYNFIQGRFLEQLPENGN